jgi:glycosyltransferase involved in cell wall biosynthesis
LIVQRRLAAYRVPLFERLRARLEQVRIDLRVLAGDAAPQEHSRADGGELPWGARLSTTYLAGGRVCWQPFGRYLDGVDLAIVSHENKLMYNHLLLVAPRSFRLAFWGHGANLQSDRPNGFRERLKRWTATRADWWFAYTARGVDLVARSGFPRSRITNLENAIDTAALRAEVESITESQLSQARRDFGLVAGSSGVFLGSLYPEKELDLLVRAGEALHRANGAFRLVVVGDGPSRGVIDAARAQHAWLKWVGSKGGREKALFLKLADVMLNPGLVGLGILDSFAASVPMVTTECGRHSPEIEYLRSNENGLMTEYSLDAFVAGVSRVLADAQYRARLRAGCAVAAERYTLENMVENFARGIEAALAV